MTDARQSIHEYAKEGNLAGVLAELSKGIDVDVRDPENDHTPLMDAASSSLATVDLVRLLIQRGANVNASASERPIVASDQLKLLEALATGFIEGSSDDPKFEERKKILESVQRLRSLQQDTPVREETILSLAIRGGNQEKIELLLDAGGNVGYIRPGGYDALIDVLCGGATAPDSQLIPILKLLIGRGASLNGISDYSESALRIASRLGRFEAVRILLDSSADPAPLEWTPILHAIALGSVADVEAELGNGADLTARDFWSRTPWLLSLQVGEVKKSQLLLAAGADRSDRGRCGRSPLMYSVVNGRTEMLHWLLSQGFDADETDEFGGTPLMEAAANGATECARVLVEAGADIHRMKHSEPVIRIASRVEIVRLLVSRGADLNDISDEMRATLTKLPNDEKIRVSREEYLATKLRQFGGSNPEKMNFPFWRSMITSGAIAFAARKRFDDTQSNHGAVWCFKRYGKSINELPDRRIIEIAGEHEDYYDPDFCIYNDVIVHHGDGTFDIYGYPKTCFPPTDFHTATLVGEAIYIIGNLGYREDRQYDETPVYRLDIHSIEIARLNTSGENPGWVNRHKAALIAGEKIRISGGQVCALRGGAEKYEDNSHEYVLDLKRLTWSKDL